MKKLILLCTAIAVTPASAHIQFSPAQGTAGSYHAGVLRVGHGCDRQGTTAVRVEIPGSIMTARPQPKPGWTLEIEYAPLASPVQPGGEAPTERVMAVTWRGQLPADQFDEFGLLLKLSEDRSGPLYLPVLQRCGTTDVRWTEVPAAGQSWHDVPRPAPFIDVREKNSAHGH